MEPDDLEAPMMTFVPTAVASTDPVFDHALCLVGFDRSCSPDHPVFKCLAEGGYDTFYHLFCLNPEEVKDLSYFNTSVNPPTWTTLNRGDQAALLTLVAYQRYFKATNGTSLTPNDWLKITVDTINDFILSSNRDFYVYGIGKLQHPGSCPPLGTKCQPSSLQVKYHKTIHLDAAQFKPLNDEHNWATWHVQFVDTACAQELQDVLDPTYVPRTPGEAAVFQAKQEYLYAVFVQNLLTEKGRACVRQYAHTRNAHAIFKELLDHHAKPSCDENLKDCSILCMEDVGYCQAYTTMVQDGYSPDDLAVGLSSDSDHSNHVSFGQLTTADSDDDVGWDPSILYGEESPPSSTGHQVEFLTGSSWDSPTFDGEYMCTGQEEFPMSSPTGDNCITLKASSSNCFKGTKVVNVQVLAGPCSIHTRKLHDEHLVVGFFLDDGNPGDHRMHIWMTFNIEEPPGTRPPPEPPPMTLMHPSYNDHVDDPIHPNRLFDGELSPRVLPESMIPPDHIEYGDILIYGETMDHINKDSSNSNQVMKDHPCLPITLTTKDICNLEYGWGESLYGKVGVFCMEDAERTTKCCKCHCWHHNRRFVCTRVKTYNTPNWGGGGTCLTCEGTAEE